MTWKITENKLNKGNDRKHETLKTAEDTLDKRHGRKDKR